MLFYVFLNSGVIFRIYREHGQLVELWEEMLRNRMKSRGKRGEAQEDESGLHSSL